MSPFQRVNKSDGEPNKTRVFATTIGHHNETMIQENYQDMITRGFLWASGKPVAEYIKN